MDHLIQIPQVDRAWEPIPEPWVDPRPPGRPRHRALRLGTLVSPVTFRRAGHHRQDRRHAGRAERRPGVLRARRRLVAARARGVRAGLPAGRASGWTGSRSTIETAARAVGARHQGVRGRGCSCPRPPATRGRSATCRSSSAVPASGAPCDRRRAGRRLQPAVRSRRRSTRRSTCSARHCDARRPRPRRTRGDHRARPAGDRHRPRRRRRAGSSGSGAGRRRRPSPPDTTPGRPTTHLRRYRDAGRLAASRRSSSRCPTSTQPTTSNAWRPWSTRRDLGRDHGSEWMASGSTEVAPASASSAGRR